MKTRSAVHAEGSSTGIRLLLVFVAVNTILFAMLVTAMTSTHPWLANFLPGGFETGNGSGYWVFFSLVLLVNAVTVLLAGFVMIDARDVFGPARSRPRRPPARNAPASPAISAMPAWRR